MTMMDDMDDSGRHRQYIATLNVAPNPGIGPNIITVLSIEECRIDAWLADAKASY